MILDTLSFKSVLLKIIKYFNNRREYSDRIINEIAQQDWHKVLRLPAGHRT